MKPTSIRSRLLPTRLTASLAMAGTVLLLAAVQPTSTRTAPDGTDPVRVASASNGDETAAPNRYIGALRCKNCHQAKESGDQFGAWEASKHAHAFEELASDKAKEYGKKAGVENPQTDPKCVKCHVTAYGKPKEEVHRSFDPKLGVQCETCHGPGEAHMKARMAAAATAKPDEKAGHAQIPDDEIIKVPAKTLCVECHNEQSPGYKPFCYHEFEAKIRHLNPLIPRTAEQLAALDVCTCEPTCKCKKDSKDGKCTMPNKGAKATEAGGAKKEERGDKK